MKKKFPIMKRNIRREIRKEIIGKPSRKISTQEKTVHHLMKIMKVTMIHKRYYLWLGKIKEPPIVLKNKTKSISKKK
jgi:hypothetical protein